MPENMNHFAFQAKQALSKSTRSVPSQSNTLIPRTTRARSEVTPLSRFLSDSGGSVMADELSGSCFCGAVTLTVSGAPTAMGYCHCASCRSWSAGPVNAFSLWPPEAVRITQGSEHVRSFKKSETSVRKWCDRCGGHLLTEHPLWGVTDVYAAILPDLAFEPGLHVNYAETVLQIRDGLPKQKDVPSEMGGSGQLVAD